jgi:hypothetical protein
VTGVSPEIRDYLAARVARDEALAASDAAFEGGDDDEWHVAFDAYFQERERFSLAAVACLPRELADLRLYWGDVGLPSDGRPYAGGPMTVLETAYVWIPLLAAELGMDRARAETAWVLGVRPQEWKEPDND